MKFFTKLSSVFLTERGQLLFGMLLVILVPFTLVINTYSTVVAARQNMDTELKRKALMTESVFQAATIDYLSDPTKMQAAVDRLQSATTEVWGVEVLIREGEQFKVVASAVPNTVGTTTDNLNAVIAWHQKQAIAFQTFASTHSTISQEVSYGDGKERYWVVINPIMQDGTPVGLVSMKFSSAIIDDLTRASVSRAFVIMIVSIIIVIGLLLLNTKLFQYTVLFRKLKEVDEMKDEFISVASHELRTPITGIRGYLSMILDGSLGAVPDQVKKPLTVVNQSADRLAVLVEDLLNVSRIEQGRMDLELTEVEPRPVIDEVVAELMPMAQEKKLAVKYAGLEQLPRLNINRDRFKQVMINLVGNGIKYTPKGSVTIEPQVRDQQLVIKVADTGLGMSPKDMARLFTKFYRIRTDQTQEIAGTGLGLWITKQLIEKMKGTVEVESIEGVGSQFIITFPVLVKKPATAKKTIVDKK